MSDCDLFCNIKKCRRRLLGHAWVTSCSHAFCDDDGRKWFANPQPPEQQQGQGENQNNKCPVCQAVLPTVTDVIRMDLNPSEQFKSAHAEHVYQEALSKSYRERLTQVELSYEALLAKIKSEMLGLKYQIETTKKELAEQMQRAEELAEKLMEKTRQCKKFQAMYEAMRRSNVDVGCNSKSVDRPASRGVPEFQFTPVATPQQQSQPPQNAPLTSTNHYLWPPRFQRPTFAAPTTAQRTPSTRSHQQTARNFSFLPASPPSSDNFRLNGR